MKKLSQQAHSTSMSTKLSRRFFLLCTCYSIHVRMAHKPGDLHIIRCYVVRLYYTGWACPVHYKRTINQSTTMTSQHAAVGSLKGGTHCQTHCLQYRELITTAPHCRVTCTQRSLAIKYTCSGVWSHTHH